MFHQPLDRHQIHPRKLTNCHLDSFLGIIKVAQGRSSTLLVDIYSLFFGGIQPASMTEVRIKCPLASLDNQLKVSGSQNHSFHRKLNQKKFSRKDLRLQFTQSSWHDEIVRQ